MSKWPGQKTRQMRNCWETYPLRIKDKPQENKAFKPKVFGGGRERLGAGKNVMCFFAQHIYTGRFRGLGSSPVVFVHSAQTMSVKDPGREPGLRVRCSGTSILWRRERRKFPRGEDAGMELQACISSVWNCGSALKWHVWGDDHVPSKIQKSQQPWGWRIE